MKWSVTGECGSVGSNLAAKGIRRGVEVILLDHRSRVGVKQNQAWLRGLGLWGFHQLDVRDVQSVTECVARARPGTVFPWAGQVAVEVHSGPPKSSAGVYCRYWKDSPGPRLASLGGVAAGLAHIQQWVENHAA